jgi:hypothetical protein
MTAGWTSSLRQMRSLSCSQYAVLIVVILATSQAISVIHNRRYYNSPNTLCTTNNVPKRTSSSGSLRNQTVFAAESVNATSVPVPTKTKTTNIDRKPSDRPRVPHSPPLPATTSKSRYYYRPLPGDASDNDTLAAVGVQARAFDAWPRNRPLPCEPAEPNWVDYSVQTTPTDHGLLFLKPYKTGSSTASGITLRMSRNIAARNLPPPSTAHGVPEPMCRTRYDHGWASHLFPTRVRQRSFLWTLVRDPTARVVSQFFHFQVSRKKTEPSDENFKNYVRHGPVDMIHDYYLDALSTSNYRKGRTDPVATVNGIFRDYDFVGVTERMDESAVALAMLLRLPLADILYLKAKGHGGYDDAGGSPNKKCTYIWPSFVSSGLQEFFRTDEWQNIVQWDHAVFQAANRSLDLTIDKLGRTKFDHFLRKFREAKALAHDRCLPKTVFPCSEGGIYHSPEETDCLWNDSGCANKCLDEISTELELWEHSFA